MSINRATPTRGCVGVAISVSDKDLLSSILTVRKITCWQASSSEGPFIGSTVAANTLSDGPNVGIRAVVGLSSHRPSAAKTVTVPPSTVSLPSDITGVAGWWAAAPLA